MKLRLSFGILLATIAVLIHTAADSSAAETKRPNIILILADDLGFETINCYGGTSYKTPNLDRLAQTGLRFPNCFATPLCSPSRAEIMTGRYGFRTGWINLIGRGKEEDVKDYFDPSKERTFGQMLKDAGYATAIAGKWQLCEFEKHPNHAKRCGFDESCLWAWVVKEKATSRYWAPVVWENGKRRDFAPTQYGDDIFSDFLIDFMKRHKDGPFLLYYPMALVHGPHIAPPGSPKAAAAQRAAAQGEKPKGAGKKGQRNQDQSDRAVNDPANYPDMIAYMDKLVGKITSAVDELGLSENTIILFTGDNGTDRKITSRLGDLEIRGGKGTVTELGAHVPFIARWSGTMPTGKTCNDLVDFSDFFPTLAELAGATVPGDRKIDGRSFAPQLRGQTGQPREWVFTQLGHDTFARDQRFILHQDGRMFDAANDLFEKNDLAGSRRPDVTEAKKRLQAVLDQAK